MIFARGKSRGSSAYKCMSPDYRNAMKTLNNNLTTYVRIKFFKMFCDKKVFFFTEYINNST